MAHSCGQPMPARKSRLKGGCSQDCLFHSDDDLFVSQGIDGVDAAGLDGGGDDEDHSDGDRDAEGDDHGGGGDDGFPLGGAGDEPGEEEAEGNAQESAADGDEDGLGEKLADDNEPATADGAADADFEGTFHDGGEDDVNDADAAKEEGEG